MKMIPSSFCVWSGSSALLPSCCCCCCSSVAQIHIYSTCRHLQLFVVTCCSCTGMGHGTGRSALQSHTRVSYVRLNTLDGVGWCQIQCFRLAAAQEILEVCSREKPLLFWLPGHVPSCAATTACLQLTLLSKHAVRKSTFVFYVFITDRCLGHIDCNPNPWSWTRAWIGLAEMSGQRCCQTRAHTRTHSHTHTRQHAPTCPQQISYNVKAALICLQCCSPCLLSHSWLTDSTSGFRRSRF